MRVCGPVAISLLSTLVVSGSLFAAPLVYGPFQDLRTTIGPITGPVSEPTGCTGPPVLGVVPDGPIIFDGVFGATVHALGVMYFSTDTPDFLGPVTITTIYGMDAAPGSPDLHMTGFNPVSPELFPLSGETIYGDSGTPYYSSSDYGAIPLSSLASVFPELDLSLIQGDPNSVVWAFRTTVPGSDLVNVPEPTVLALVLSGIGVLAASIGRRRVR